MRPLFVEELAAHPDYQGKGVGGFMLEQLQHLARLRGCTHLVLEVAENNEDALRWDRKRNLCVCPFKSSGDGAATPSRFA